MELIPAYRIIKLIELKDYMIARYYSIDRKPVYGIFHKNGMTIHTGYKTFSAMYLDLLRIRLIDDLFE